MAALPDLFAQLMRPIRRIAAGARAFTQSFNPNSTAILAVPGYRDHLNDLLSTRQAQDSRQLMQSMFRTDTDLSATVAAYLTLADTPVKMLVHDLEGQIDLQATQDLRKIVTALTRPTDYSQGFQAKPGLRRLFQELRYMLLMRGAIAGELVFDRRMVPERIQQVDMVSIEWFENESGVFKPRQRTRNGGELIDLDIPSFFVAYHRRDPTTVYPSSDFISAINTIAARTQVINDLYRIMRVTGFPRLDITVLEEVVRNNMPPAVRDDPQTAKTWLQDRLNEVGAQFATVRADQPFLHYDSAKVEIVNKERPGAALQIDSVIETLNAQNQAGLKTMATIIGRAKQGTNTASTEARLAALYADQLNVPVAEFLERMLTFMLNVYGIPGMVSVEFDAAELRPNLELEPQKTMRAARLREDLSLGVITDVEYHLQVHGRLPPDTAPALSGTGFMGASGVSIDTEDVTPNSDPLGRSMASPGARSARSNTVRRAA